MKNKIVELKIENNRPPADSVLKEAMGKMERVIVIGEDADGNFYYKCNATNETAVYMMEFSKAKIISDIINA